MATARGLLDSCIEGATEAGAEVQKLAVASRDIGPCDSCDECALTGVCVIFDDMTDLYPRLEDADALIVASPVYFASVPAQLKAFYDRCQPFWARVHALGGEQRSPRRPGAFLVVRGGGDPYGFDCAITPTRASLPSSAWSTHTSSGSKGRMPPETSSRGRTCSPRPAR